MRHKIQLAQVISRILPAMPAATLLIIVFFYGWTAFTSRMLTEAAAYPYQELARAFRHGQLHFLTLPSNELLSLSDPYDPILNQPYRRSLHDVSLYNGRYFLYFGPLPAVFLFLPAQLLGFQMTGAIACLILGTILLIVQTLIVIKALGKKTFDHPVLLSATIMLLGFGSLTPMLLRRPAMYEIAILTGALFLSCSILCIVLALNSRTTNLKLDCAAIIFSFMAFSSRPSQIVALVMTLFLFIVVISRTRRQKALYLCISTLPTLLICGYNYFRFGSILEFGLNWILAGNDLRSVPTFNLGWIKPKLFGDLFTLPNFVSTFPWLKFNHPALAPAFGASGLEPSVGLLIIAPWLLPMFGLFIYFSRRLHKSDQRIFFLIVYATLTALGSFTTQMIVMPTITYRYLGDYAPFIFLGAAVFIFHTGSTLQIRNLPSALGISICLCTTVMSIGLLSFTGYYNPLGF